MSVRVGRTKGQEFKGFETISVWCGKGKYSCLSPYDLKDENGHLHENIWQFSKVYEKIPKSVQRKSRWDNTIIWDHPSEAHVMDGQLTEEYFKWREKGFNCQYPIRYPVGYNHRHKCVGSLKSTEGDELELLDWVESRKQIYLPLYDKLVRKEKKFEELKEKLKNGQNLLLIEPDGPHPEDAEYYAKFGVKIENETILMNEHNLKFLLNDTKRPFGHGYCLGLALLDIELI